MNGAIESEITADIFPSARYSVKYVFIKFHRPEGMENQDFYDTCRQVYDRIDGLGYLHYNDILLNDGSPFKFDTKSVASMLTTADGFHSIDKIQDDIIDFHMFMDLRSYRQIDRPWFDQINGEEYLFED